MGKERIVEEKLEDKQTRCEKVADAVSRKAFALDSAIHA